MHYASIPFEVSPTNKTSF